MQKIHVNASRQYDILLDQHLLEQSGELIRRVTKAAAAVIVTDDHVDPLYRETVEVSMRRAGFTVSVFVIPHGETSKSHDILLKLYEFLAEHAITRKDILVALGGGVVGDLTGYCAATYLRGIEFIQIPTTLLAQIDSSVGGKTAVNIAAGKNLIGSFWQPSLVICSLDTLDTLSDEIFADGLAEAIKYGCIWDQDLFRLIAEEDIKTHLAKIIYTCIDIKRQVVEADEFDHGTRMLLNFGHTLGHAIERHFHYETYTHGCGVAIGMATLTALSEEYGLTASGTTEALRSCLRKHHLPVETPMTPQEYYDGCVHDKKRAENRISLVLLKEIGKAYPYQISVDDLLGFLKKEGAPHAG